jgi:hypothetical protein
MTLSISAIMRIVSFSCNHALVVQDVFFRKLTSRLDRGIQSGRSSRKSPLWVVISESPPQAPKRDFRIHEAKGGGTFREKGFPQDRGTSEKPRLVTPRFVANGQPVQFIAVKMPLRHEPIHKRNKTRIVRWFQ